MRFITRASWEKVAGSFRARARSSTKDGKFRALHPDHVARLELRTRLNRRYPITFADKARISSRMKCPQAVLAREENRDSSTRNFYFVGGKKSDFLEGGRKGGGERGRGRVRERATCDFPRRKFSNAPSLTHRPSETNNRFVLLSPDVGEIRARRRHRSLARAQFRSVREICISTRSRLRTRFFPARIFIRTRSEREFRAVAAAASEKCVILSRRSSFVKIIFSSRGINKRSGRPLRIIPLLRHIFPTFIRFPRSG